MARNPKSPVQARPSVETNSPSLTAERAFLLSLIDKIRVVYRKGPVGEVLIFICFLLLLSGCIAALGFVFGRSFVDALLICLILVLVSLALRFLIEFACGSWQQGLRLALLALLFLALGVWWQFDFLAFRRGAAGAYFQVRLNLNALVAADSSQIGALLQDVSPRPGLDFGTVDISRCISPNAVCDHLSDALRDKGKINVAARTQLLISEMQENGTRRVSKEWKLDPDSDRNGSRGSDVYLIGNKIIFEDAKLDLGRSRLIVVANELVVEGQVEVRAYPRGPKSEQESGTGEDGRNAGNVDIYVFGSITGKGKMRMDLRGQDGDNGTQGKPGEARKDEDTPPNRSSAAIGGFYAPSEYEARFLNPRVQNLPTPADRDAARHIYQEAISGCKDAASCRLFVCAKEAEKGYRGYPGNSGHPGLPGGRGGDGGEFHLYLLAGSLKGRNDVFEITDGTSANGISGPGGAAGPGGRGGPGGLPDVLGACFEGPIGDPGPVGAEGEGKKPRIDYTSKSPAYKLEIPLCIKLSLGMIGANGACR